MRKNEKKDKKEKLSLFTVVRYNFLMLKKIVRMAPQYIVFVVIVSVISGITKSMRTVFTYHLFNLLDTPDVVFAKVVLYILLLLLTHLGIQLFQAWYYQYYKPIMDRKFQHKMHGELFEHALKMDLACYDDPKFYNDYVWAMDESKTRAVQVMEDVSRFIEYGISMSTMITLMMQTDVVVATILLIGAIINALTWTWESKIWFKQRERTKPFQRKNSYVNRVYHLSDYAKELRISRADENLREIYSESMANITEEEVRAGKIQYLCAVVGTIVSEVAKILPMVILLFKLYNGTAPLGGFVASVNIIWRLTWEINDLARNATRLQEHAQYIKRYLKFLSYEPKIVSGDVMAEPLESIELRNVTFSYQPLEEKEKEGGAEEKEEVKNSLEGINLTIRKGEKVAVVGYNGAGKTTLTKLLMRLYDPVEGEILYNGKDLREYDIPSLRARIGTVFQDYKIFAATIGENVLGSECEDADRDIALDALTKSTFREKLDSLEKGIDTELTKEFYEDGVNLSGGEAQKVAIARVFAKPYDLVIMDEPSSALDPIAEYELNHTILEYAKDKTVVFISHRLSTTRMADRILMFADGRLIECGSHDELLAQNGKYAEMFKLQAEKYRTQTPT